MSRADLLSRGVHAAQSWVADVIFENGGVMTSANLGSTLASRCGVRTRWSHRSASHHLFHPRSHPCRARSNEARYHTIKATFGGLCGLLSRFPERFVLVNNPPLNHVVALGRASASSRQAGGARHGASRGGGLPAERRGASPSNLGLALAGTSAGSPPGARGAQGGRSAQGSAPALGGGEPTLGGGASASAALVEREIVRCTHDILAHARDHSLKAVELANALRARVGVEALSRVREQHGGLLSLLEHHPQTFAVRRVPKHDSIALVVPPAFRAAAAPRGGDVGDPAGCAPPSWPTAPPTSNAADAAVNSPVLPPPPPHHAHYMGRHPRQAHYDAAAIGCGADGYGVPRSWSPPTSAQPHAATRPPGAVLGPVPASVFIDSHGHQHWSSGALAAPAAAPELSQFAQYRCSQPLADSDTTAVVATQSSSSSLSSHSRSPASLSPPLTADAAAYSPPLHTTAPPHPEPSPHFAPPQFLAAGGGADGGTTSSPFSAMPGAVVGESSQHATRAHGGALALLMNENYVPTKAWPVGALPAGEDDALVCVVAELLHAQHGAATLTKLRALLKQHFGLLTSVKSVPLRSFLAAHAYRFATEGTHVTLRQ